MRKNIIDIFFSFRRFVRTWRTFFRRKGLKKFLSRPRKRGKLTFWAYNFGRRKLFFYRERRR